MRSSALSGRSRPGRRASPPRTRSLASPVSSSPERSTRSWRRTSPSPTLLLTGEQSPDFLKTDIATLADVLPDARVLVLEAQQHVADVLVPEVFAGHLLAFLRDLPAFE
jgi:hypothetical protein